jgi:hypothetical protein
MPVSEHGDWSDDLDLFTVRPIQTRVSYKILIGSEGDAERFVRSGVWEALQR